MQVMSFVILAIVIASSTVHAGMATRYWDCCMASGSWQGKADVYNSVDVCKKDGVTRITGSAKTSGQSSCNGGENYMCNSMQPYNDTKDKNLAYGFAAFSSSGNEADFECACYHAEFTSASGAALPRSKLLFQSVNIGPDVNGGNLDLQIPGGGVGLQNSGCMKQWDAPNQGWGQQYGGVSSISDCSQVPAPLQAGCQWRFNSWGDNPNIKSITRVKCPKGLIDRSGCQRKDDAKQTAYSGTTDAQGMPAPDQYARVLPGAKIVSPINKQPSLKHSSQPIMRHNRTSGEPRMKRCGVSLA